MLLKADWASRMNFNKSVHIIQAISKPVKSPNQRCLIE